MNSAPPTSDHGLYTGGNSVRHQLHNEWTEHEAQYNILKYLSICEKARYCKMRLLGLSGLVGNMLKST